MHVYDVSGFDSCASAETVLVSGIILVSFFDRWLTKLRRNVMANLNSRLPMGGSRRWRAVVSSPSIPVPLKKKWTSTPIRQAWWRYLHPIQDKWQCSKLPCNSSDVILSLCQPRICCLRPLGHKPLSNSDTLRSTHLITTEGSFLMSSLM